MNHIWPDRKNEYWRRSAFLRPPENLNHSAVPSNQKWESTPNSDSVISFDNGVLLEDSFVKGIKIDKVDPGSFLKKAGFISGGQSWNEWTILNGNVYEVTISKNFTADQPLIVREKISSEGNITSSYIFFNIEENVELSVCYLMEGFGDGFHSGGFTFNLNNSSNLKLMHFQNISKESKARFNWEVKTSEGANAEWHLAAFGGKQVRHECRLEMKGKGSNSSLKGIYIPFKGQRHEFQTQQDHQKGDSTSDLLLKGAVCSASRGIFQGMINIRPDAQKSNAYQTNRNLSLSSNAKVETIPGLEIEANDVKCSHGATVSKIDPYSLFYLAARGIDKKEAAQLLAEGFFYEISDDFPDEMKSIINSEIQERLLEAF